ncbi:MAG: helix-turn-helix domain-containing protein [Actinobacteria bacterium]|nr:helix-turn-helix domain-containing protein [Actinomycetota bacterium]
MAPQETADLLCVPISTLRHWLWRGRFPEGFPRPLKIGRGLRWERAAVMAWLDAQIAASKSGDRS